MTAAAPDPTSREGLVAILAATRAAAAEGAQVAAGGYRRRAGMTVEHKESAVDLVTQFDRDSERAIRGRLAAAFPFAIVGEEQGGATADVAFYVDPVDGTTNFVHGHPFWCVSIGLVVAGEPVLGVVLSPALGIEWSGWIAASGERYATRRSVDASAVALLTGAGAAAPRVIEEPCAVSAVEHLEEALLATGFPYDRRTSADNNFDAFVAIKRRCQAVRRCGSAALDLCLVADGTYDGYWERKLRPWDIAAGTALVRAAGGRVTALDGGPFGPLASGNVVATNARIHDALTDELARVVPSTRF